LPGFRGGRGRVVGFDRLGERTGHGGHIIGHTGFRCGVGQGRFRVCRTPDHPRHAQADLEQLR
jgi:hypothetical protein